LLYFPNFGATRSRGALKQIDELHKAFKPRYMESGLGLGQFYPGCPIEGVYTDTEEREPRVARKKFLPLVSPEPAFAIRYLAKHDSIFNPEGSEFRYAYEKFFPATN